MGYRTPQAAIDVVMAQPPFNDLPPGFDGVAPGMQKREMSRPEATRILMELQRVEALSGHARNTQALEMGVAQLVRRHRQDCRHTAKRRLVRQQAYDSKAAEPLSPEAELAATVARQKGEEVDA